MIELDLNNMHDWFGFGVAGNFAGHLDQAGEAIDFQTVVAKEGAREGNLPLVRPGHDSFLGEFPLSHDALIVPPPTEATGPVNLPSNRRSAWPARWSGTATPSPP